MFDMLQIPFKNIIPYIEFSFSYVKSETVTNTITTFNIEYKKIMKIIENFYIQFGNEEDVEINKKSLNKIFNLIGLPANKRLNFMQFYEVDEDVIYEEEEEEDDIEKNTSIRKFTNNKNSNTYNKTYIILKQS